MMTFKILGPATPLYHSCLHRYSVLDKIVPGYYHRRLEDGEVCHSTCCNNTATENAMCERLVIDDIVHWAKNYKVWTIAGF